MCNQTWNWTTTLFSREIIHKCKHVWEFQFQFWLPDGQSDTRTSALNKESINLHSSSIDPFLSVDIATGDDLWHPGWWCNNHLEKHFPIIIPLVNGKIPNHQPASSGWFKPMDGSEKKHDVDPTSPSDVKVSWDKSLVTKNHPEIKRGNGTFPRWFSIKNPHL